MTRSRVRAAVAAMAMAAVLGAAGRASAQEAAGPGKLELTFIPAGATFFTNQHSGPNVNDYNIGTAVTLNILPMLGVEGEMAGAFGLKQHLPGQADVDTPNMLSYSGNLVLGLGTHALVPYVTGGVGGLTVYSSRDLGFDDSIGTFWTGNVGAGLKWYQGSGRWGLRGDYRFQFTQSKDDAPEFFGRDSRHGNRIYGGLVLNVIK